MTYEGTNSARLHFSLGERVEVIVDVFTGSLGRRGVIESFSWDGGARIKYDDGTMIGYLSDYMLRSLSAVDIIAELA